MSKKKKKKKTKRGGGSSYGKRKNNSSASSPSSYLQKLLTSPSLNPNMKRTFKRAKFTFFGDELPYYVESDKFQYQQALCRCLEWFVFDTKVTIDFSELSPAEHWLKNSRDHLSSEEVENYEQLMSPVFGVFEITQIDKGSGIRIYDVQDEREYYIHEKLGTISMVRGGTLIGRIFPWKGDYIMSGAMSFFPKGGFKDLINDFSTQGRSVEKFDALTWEMYFKLNKTEPIEKLKSLNANKKKIIPFLNLLTRGTLTWNSLLNQIKEAEEPFDFIDPLMAEIEFFSSTEKELLTRYLLNLWNYVPRPSFEEKTETGEIEKCLTKEMVEYVTSRMKPDDYPTREAAIDAAHSIKDEWFNNPQDKLGNKTPLMSIMEERRELGNPSQKLELSFDFRRI